MASPLTGTMRLSLLLLATKSGAQHLDAYRDQPARRWTKFPGSAPAALAEPSFDWADGVYDAFEPPHTTSHYRLGDAVTPGSFATARSSGGHTVPRRLAKAVRRRAEAERDPFLSAHTVFHSQPEHSAHRSTTFDWAEGIAHQERPERAALEPSSAERSARARAARAALPGPTQVPVGSGSDGSPGESWSAETGGRGAGPASSSGSVGAEVW